MRIALGTTKAKDTHSEFVTRFVYPRQQWLRERTSMLRLYLHCLLNHKKNYNFLKIKMVL